MAAQYVKEIRTLQPEGPYYLLGYSAGGMWALEIAQQLLSQGQEVALLALLDTYGRARKPFHQRILPYFRHKFLPNLVKRPLNFYLGARYFLKAGAEKLRRSTLRAILDSDHPKLKLFDFEDFYFRAYDGYVPKVYPGRIYFFWATLSVSPTTVERRLAWHDLAAGGLEIHEIHAVHGGMLPGTTVVAERLSALLPRGQIDYCAEIYLG